MAQQSRILIVDDTTDSRMLLKMLLEDNYEITEAASGEECLLQTTQQLPDLVLLDVNMPGMSGYEVCMNLRKQEETRHLPVIFVSALDTNDERLAGFEAGANDYLIKPVDPESLLTKIIHALEYKQKMKSVQDSSAEAMLVAMEAMTVSSEMGQIVQYIKDISTLKTPLDIGDSILKMAQEFGLDVAVKICNGKGEFVGCEADSMEARVLNKALNQSIRILSVGIHTVIKNDHIALLIIDMPVDDANRYGRLKDHFAVLMDIAEGHLKVLQAQATIMNQRTKFLNRIIAVAEKQIKLTSKEIQYHDEVSQEIMQGMITELEGMLFGLGLDDDQENRLVQLADQTSLKLEQTRSSTQELSVHLGVILESLYEFLEKDLPPG